MGTVSGGRRRAFRSRHHAPMGQGGKLAVIFVCTALLLFVFAVMLGNHLRGLAVALVEDTTEPIITEYEIYNAKTPDEVIAMGIVFGADTYSSESETLSETAEENTVVSEDQVKFNSLSLTLRKKDKASGEMQLAYSSSLSSEYEIDVLGDTALEEGLAAIRNFYGEKMRICGIFEINHLSRPEQSRGVMRAYEIALICELIDAGIDEILLLGFENEINAGISFISDVYKQKGRGTVIGMGLPFECFVSSDAQVNLADITSHCGFIALDLSSIAIPALMTVESVIADRVARTLSVCQEYSIRVLLGCGENPDCVSQTRAALNAGSNNVMTALGILDAKEETIITAE